MSELELVVSEQCPGIMTVYESWVKVDILDTCFFLYGYIFSERTDKTRDKLEVEAFCYKQ